MSGDVTRGFLKRFTDLLAGQDKYDVEITGGEISNVTLTDIEGLTLDIPLEVGSGGTGADNASDARDNLGLTIGSDVAAYAVDNSSFEVLTGTDAQSLWDENDSALLKARGTEVFSGATVSFTIGETVFDVGATVGQIKDSTGYYSINYAGATDIALISTVVSSVYVYIDNTGALQQQTTEPTRDEFRTKLFITRLALVGGTLAAQESIVNPSGQYTNTVRDYLSYVSSPKKGLDISPNANLTFQVAAGSIFELGSSFSTNIDNPNEISFTAQNPASFFYLKRDAIIASGQTNINVTQYDNNGTLTTLTNNRFKIMTVYKFGSGNHIVQEGQAQYTSLDNAQTAISTRTFVENPTVANGTRIGWIIVQKDATNLQTSTTARFIQDNGSFSTSVGTAGALIASNNLSDVADAATSRGNLGLGDLSTLDTVGTTEIDDNAVTGDKIDDNAVTLAKLAGGTAGKVIGFDGSGDPAEVDSGGGSIVRPPMASGVYYAPLIQDGAQDTATITLGVLRTCLFTVDEETEFDAVSAFLNSSTSTNARYGIYSVGSDGRPDSLIEDFGEITSSSIGAKEISITTTLSAGSYYLAHIANVTVSWANAASASGFGVVGVDVVSQGVSIGYSETRAYGALPSSFVGTTRNFKSPIMYLRKA